MTRTRAEIEAVIAELAAVHGFGGTNPSEQQLRELLSDERKGAVQYLNLLRFRAVAAYPIGHELAGAGLTGEQAYMLYGAVALQHVQQRGGDLPMFCRVDQTIIGESGRWDQVAVMQYPDRDAFIEMIRDPDYQSSLVHRDAGLEATAVLITTSLLPAVR